jgi:TonB family protein
LELFVNRLSIVIILGAIAALPAYGITEDPVQQLLISAKQQADLSLNTQDSFELVVDFTAQEKLPSQGHLTLKWKSKEQWWRLIELGSYKQIDVRNDGWLYTSRNSSSTPVRVRQLIQLLHFGEDAKDLVTDKRQQMMEYGFPVDCLRVRKKHEKDSPPHQVCLNGSHEISSDTWWDLPDSPTREEFADYFSFANHRYPRTLQLVENGSRVVKANVKSLSARVLNEVLLTKPEGAIERRQCDNWKPPQAVKTPDPPYPPSASHNGTIGDSIVSMTVLADGSATDFQLIGSATKAMDQSTLDTLKKWKFKPATCGSEPVVSDVEVIVSFRLSVSRLQQSLRRDGESKSLF